MPVGLQQVNVGTTPGDGTGDTGRAAFQKVNSNFDILEASLEDAERKAFVIACTDENETIEARLTALGDSDLSTFRMPYAFVLTEVRASLKVEDSGGDVDIDILENGVSIFASGDILTIPAGSKTSVGHSPQPNVLYTILEDDNEITIQNLAAPSGGTAAGLKVTLLGYVIWTTF